MLHLEVLLVKMLLRLIITSENQGYTFTFGWLITELKRIKNVYRIYAWWY